MAILPGFYTNLNRNYQRPALLGDGAGIELTGAYTDNKATPNQSVVISANVCHDNQVGIRSEEDTRHVSIVGNSCNHNDKHGIFIFSSRFCSVSTNQYCSNGEHGICVEKLSNRIVQNTARPEQNTFSGNICTENNRFGIALIGAWQCTVVGNTCSGNNQNATQTGGGVGLFTVDELAVTYCSFMGNTLISYFQSDHDGIYSDSDAHARNVI